VSGVEDPAAPPGAEQPIEAVDAARATTGRSVLRGGLWYLASYAVPQLYTIVLSVVGARFLGPDRLGVQSFIAFVSLSTITALSSSMYSALMRYVGETLGAGRSDLLPGLFRWAWRIEAAAAAVGAGSIAAAALLGAEPGSAWLLAAVVCAAGILHTVPTAVLIGLQRFRQAAVVGLTTGFAATVATVIVLWAGGGITGMFAVEAVVGVLNLAWTGTLARRSVPRTRTSERDRAAAVRLRRGVGRYALLSSVGLVLELIVGTRSEFVFLQHYSSHSQIAFYSIAFSAVAALRLFPRALGGSTTPAFATLYGARAFDRISSGYSRALRLLVLGTLPLTTIAFALAPALIREVYGQSYGEVARPLQILLLAFPLIALSSVGNAVLVGYGRIRLPLIANTVAAVVDIGLAFLLIPHLDAEGAAIANVGGEGTYVALVLVFAARLVRPVDWRPWAIMRGLLAAAWAGLAAWGGLEVLGNEAGLIVGLAAAVVVFGALATAFRIIPADDARWLEESFGSRLGGAVGWLVRLWSARPAAQGTP
jgi:O-antigen/teichoic acid export membrane protein